MIGNELVTKNAKTICFIFRFTWYYNRGRLLRCFPNLFWTYISGCKWNIWTKILLNISILHYNYFMLHLACERKMPLAWWFLKFRLECFDLMNCKSANWTEENTSRHWISEEPLYWVRLYYHISIDLWNIYIVTIEKGRRKVGYHITYQISQWQGLGTTYHKYIDLKYMIENPSFVYLS